MYPIINRGNRDRKFHLRIKGWLRRKQKLASYQIPREINAVENFPHARAFDTSFAPYNGDLNIKVS